MLITSMLVKPMMIPVTFVSFVNLENGIINIQDIIPASNENMRMFPKLIFLPFLINRVTYQNRCLFQFFKFCNRLVIFFPKYETFFVPMRLICKDFF